jgi:hypothetical protein
MLGGARGERRARTIRRALTRRRDHLRLIHGGDPNAVACLCELAPLYFAKRRACGCHCRKRRRGQPRLGVGDKSDLRARVYRLRDDARELNRLISRRCDPDGDAVALLCRRHHF